MSRPVCITPQSLTAEQSGRLDRLEGRYPATSFYVLHGLEAGAVLVEWDDAESCGTFTLHADGVVTS